MKEDYRRLIETFVTIRWLYQTLISSRNIVIFKLANNGLFSRSGYNQDDDRRHQIFRRDSGYDDHHCQSTGLEIFAFLLFLVYLLDLLRNVLMNAMLNVMINDQTVTALQGNYI